MLDRWEAMVLWERIIVGLVAIIVVVRLVQWARYFIESIVRNVLRDEDAHREPPG